MGFDFSAHGDPVQTLVVKDYMNTIPPIKIVEGVSILGVKVVEFYNLQLQEITNYSQNIQFTCKNTVKHFNLKSNQFKKSPL